MWVQINLVNVCIIQERLVGKRDDLAEKHEDARLLKADIDRRCKPIVTTMYQSLTSAEFADCEYFVLMKSQLELERRDVEYAIQLGDRQLQLLNSAVSALALHISDC